MATLKEKFINNIDFRYEGLKYIEKNHLKNKKTIQVKKFKELVASHTKTAEKINNINNIIKDVHYIYDALIDLYKLNIHFSIHIVGGCVRDLLFNNKIKDLDIVIEIINNPGFLNPKRIKNKIGIDVNTIQEFDPTEVNGVKVYLSEDSKIFYLIRELLKNKINITKEYDHTFKGVVVESNPIEENDYPIGLFNNILKVSDPNLNYALDLMLSQYDPSRIVNNFDINICKSYVTLVNGKKTILNIFDCVENIEDFYKNLIINEHLIEDALNKKLTIDVDRISKQKLISTLTSHIYRVKDKFPDYEINFIHVPVKEDGIFSKDFKEEQQEKLSLIESWKLSENLKLLPSNEVKNRKKSKL